MRIILTFLLASFTNPLLSQRLNADSFLLVLQSQKILSSQTQTVLDWMDVQVFSEGEDSMGYYGMKIVECADRQKNDDLKALGYTFIGYNFLVSDEKSKGLEFGLKALQIAERSENKKLIGRIYHYLAFFYDDRSAIEYDQRSLLQSEQNRDTIWILSSLYTLGRKYYSMAKYDSALFYAQQAFSLNNNSHMDSQDKEYFLPHVYTLFGNIYSKLDNPTLAKAYYNLSLESAKTGTDVLLSYPYTSLASYYRKLKNSDSAFFYAKKLYDISQRNVVSWTITPSRLLYLLFKENGNADSALKYLEINIKSKDSVSFLAKNQKIEALRFGEEIRQKELLISAKQQKDERKQNLQYAAIALGLVVFIILFFLFSHSIIANQKWIRFLGVMALLIVFEFINLFIHPYLAHATNDSPLIMLLVMVCIAALLVPVHHRLEKWISHRLVEKNKKIRLAAAKKTIAKLEPTSARAATDKEEETN